MCNTRFTKGPWGLDFDYSSVINVISENELEGSPFVCDTQHEPDAHLIAAAPEMYAMLEEIMINTTSTGGEDWFYDDVKELLAKARGEHV